MREVTFEQGKVMGSPDAEVFGKEL